jgi:4-oxalocrotonate tautomerase family enzyme
VPLIQVKMFEQSFSDETAKALAKELTDAYCRVTSEEVRKWVYVIVEGVPSKHWGIAGEVWAD